MSDIDGTVYVRLLDEGVPVFRPVPARQLAEGVYVLERIPDYDAADESWEFQPGTEVRCEYRELGGDTVLVAVAQA